MPTTTKTGPVRRRLRRPPNRPAQARNSQSKWTKSRGLDKGTHTLTWSLDPNNRLYTELDGATGHTSTDHFADDTDSPTWTNNGDGTWSRNVPDLSGNLAAIQASTGAPQLELTNLHGDTVATADATSASSTTNWYAESTEFGVPRVTSSSHRYGWLGSKKRTTSAEGFIVLMGKRTYDPASGRFFEMDPVPGGSAAAYDYANQDPIDDFDRGGTTEQGVSGGVEDLDNCIVTVTSVLGAPSMTCTVVGHPKIKYTFDIEYKNKKDSLKDALSGHAFAKCESASGLLHVGTFVGEEFIPVLDEWKDVKWISRVLVTSNLTAGAKICEDKY